MKQYLQKIDTKTMGNRYDVTPLFADPRCFSRLIADLSDPFRHAKIDLVACVDALGFILGAAIACDLKTGLLPVRKQGKLPVESDSITFQDYSGNQKGLEIRRGVVPAGSRVLLVDEWIETGAQVRAAITLIEGQGGIVVGISTINMDLNDATAEISNHYRVHTVWDAEQDAALNRMG
jgi:Adenine/guanine phosphoribosyltransferases and related PRPP-binding proteins